MQDQSWKHYLKIMYQMFVFFSDRAPSEDRLKDFGRFQGCPSTEGEGEFQIICFNLFVLCQNNFQLPIHCLPVFLLIFKGIYMFASILWIPFVHVCLHFAPTACSFGGYVVCTIERAVLLDTYRNIHSVIGAILSTPDKYTTSNIYIYV